MILDDDPCFLGSWSTTPWELHISDYQCPWCRRKDQCVGGLIVSDRIINWLKLKLNPIVVIKDKQFENYLQQNDNLGYIILPNEIRYIYVQTTGAVFRNRTPRFWSVLHHMFNARVNSFMLFKCSLFSKLMLLFFSV